MASRVTAEEVALWRKLHAAGLAPFAIAKRCGRNNCTVADHLTGRRVAGRVRKRTRPGKPHPTTGCLECDAWAAAAMAGKCKPRRCLEHGGE